jgi:GH24 family phage-related lysozyme (muramidase)
VNQVHADAIALIKEQELFVATPYQDHGGRLAQGYGHSVGDPPVIPGSEWTEEYASEVLSRDVEERAKPLRKWLEGHGVELTDRAFGACVSLIYNRGWTAFKATQVAHYLKSKEVTNHLVKAAVAFVDDENCKAKDKITGELRVFLGLKKRRIQEAALFLTKGD